MGTIRARSVLGMVLVAGSVGAVVALTVGGTGCAQLTGASGGSGSAQQSSAALMASSIEIAAPDGSYSAQSASTVPASGSNVQSLLTTIINPVAGALKESTMHLLQTIQSGQSSTSSLTFSVASLGTNLVGTANGSTSSIAYTYTINGSTYFTATTAIDASNGSFTFSTSPAINVTYTLSVNASNAVVTSTTISNATWGTLTFVQTAATGVTPETVTMSGTISGKNVSGSWNSSTGGSFVDLTGTKQCFTVSLQNTTGC